MKKREVVIPLAAGRVLEIGIGTGNNLPFYDGSRVTHVTGIDPMQVLWERSGIDLSELDFEVTYIRGTAEHIPMKDETFDSVITTFTLCSVNEVDRVLKEIHRVLKPGGKLVFSEHGKSPDESILRLQNLVNPLWKSVSGGCNLNRDIPALLEFNGFKTDRLSAQYLPGWRLTSYNYWGSALRI